MPRAISYVLFHPDRYRAVTIARSPAVARGKVVDWTGLLWLDRAPSNCDPFVLNQPWVYSYCRAANLRRSDRRDDQVEPGSWLVFCSNESANAGELVPDTVFRVADVRRWGEGRQPPAEYAYHFKNEASLLWTQHLRSGFEGDHPPSFTYEAQLFDGSRPDYSFLPVGKLGERLRIPFKDLRRDLRLAIKANVVGKYPVPLEEDQMKALLVVVRRRSRYRVVGPITVGAPPATRRGGSEGSQC